MLTRFAIAVWVLLFSASLTGQEQHMHAAPEQLGKVSFQTSCSTAVQSEFARGVALLHSFAYSDAESAFRKVGEKDPHCAMAHWGVAISYFHQLWDPPIPANFELGRIEIERAQELGARSERERGFISALTAIYANDDNAGYPKRIQSYVQAMQQVAAANPGETESQVFYALALLAAASP